ncbi:MAG: chalcone isomerase family protein [Pseudobdellovibrio sp.]
MKALMMSLVMVMGLSAQADLLTLSGGAKQIEGLTLNESATIAGTDVTMSLVGAGLRSKTVLFVPNKVYVTELFATEASNYSRNQDALKSLEQSRSVAIRMTFLRNVDAPTVASSYRDALIANSVSLNDAAISAFLSNVAKGGDALKAKSLIILLTNNADGSVTLQYEDTQGQLSTVVGPHQLQQQILSIWLGVPADSGLKTLKESLLKPVY